MSSIDQYKHSHLGFFDCPSADDFVYNNSTRKIAIYELLENIPLDEKDFDGNVGDIILGGGSGEAPAFRISIPKSILFWLNDDFDDFDNYDELFKPFWTAPEAHIFCEGFSKLGWTTETRIEFWLAENICLLLVDNVEKYASFKSNRFNKSSLTFTTADE
jgi:hypothetical protein